MPFTKRFTKRLRKVGGKKSRRRLRKISRKVGGKSRRNLRKTSRKVGGKVRGKISRKVGGKLRGNLRNNSSLRGGGDEEASQELCRLLTEQLKDICAAVKTVPEEMTKKQLSKELGEFAELVKVAAEAQKAAGAASAAEAVRQWLNASARARRAPTPATGSAADEEASQRELCRLLTEQLKDICDAVETAPEEMTKEQLSKELGEFAKLVKVAAEAQEVAGAQKAVWAVGQRLRSTPASAPAPAPAPARFKIDDTVRVLKNIVVTGDEREVREDGATVGEYKIARHQDLPVIAEIKSDEGEGEGYMLKNFRFEDQGKDKLNLMPGEGGKYKYPFVKKKDRDEVYKQKTLVGVFVLGVGGGRRSNGK